MSSLILFLRSLVFVLLMIVATVVWAPLCFLFAPLPYNKRYFLTGLWNRFVIGALRVICGVRYEVKGRENLPDAPAVLLSKHQSAWETVVLLILFDDPLFILKRELTWLPLFGWFLLKAQMIPVNRAAGGRALTAMTALARTRVGSGRQLIIFPEGTRRAAGVS